MRKIFLTGLACLFPFTVTIFIVSWLLRVLTKPFVGIVAPLLHNLPISGHLTLILSQILVLVALFFFILVLGAVGRWFVLSKILKIGDRLLNCIPLFNKIYKTSKDAIAGFFSDHSKSFQQVVMVPFPSSEFYVLGFISAQAPEESRDKNEQTQMVSILIPTAPNPSTGFLIMRPTVDLIYLDMPCSEALKYVVSCGVVTPETPKTS